MLVNELIAELIKHGSSLEARIVKDAKGAWHFLVHEFHPEALPIKTIVTEPELKTILASDTQPINSVIPPSTAEAQAHENKSETI